MAVQRNFVVRNGLEVNTSLVFTDTDNQRVGIGSTQPTTNLDVKLGGIAGTDLYMAGLSTFVNDLDCNASVVISAGASVAGFTTFTNIVQTGSGATVGFGTSVFIASGDLTIHSGDVVVGHGLSVSGISTFNGDIDLNDSLIVSMGASIAGLTTFNNTVQTGSGATVGFGTSAFISFGDLTIHQGDAVIGHGLSVAGVSTFNGRIDGENGQRSVLVGTGLSVAGITTLAGSGGITTTGGQLYVGSDLSVGGVSTFTGVGTFASDLYVGGDLFITDNITLDTNLNILGIATIGTLVVTGLATAHEFEATGFSTFSKDVDINAGLDVDGHTELDDVNVSGAATVVGITSISNTTESTSKDTGALIVNGGVGIEKTLFVGAGASVGTALTVGGVLDANDTTESSSSTTGAARFAGGVGIEKQLYVGAGASVGTGLTVGGTLDANGDLDVDGHTELDDVNVSGVSTFVGFSTFNDYVFVQDGVNVTGVVTATTFDGDVTGDITGNVSGIGTFTTLHVGTGGTVLQASDDGTIALGSGTTAATVTLNGGSIPSIGLVIALGG